MLSFAQVCTGDRIQWAPDLMDGTTCYSYADLQINMQILHINLKLWPFYYEWQ